MTASHPAFYRCAENSKYLRVVPTIDAPLEVSQTLIMPHVLVFDESIVVELKAAGSTEKLQFTEIFFEWIH